MNHAVYADPVVNGVFLAGALYYFYFATAYLVGALSTATGDGKMIQAFWLGVPLGMVLYSIIYGGAVALIRRKRK